MFFLLRSERNILCASLCQVFPQIIFLKAIAYVYAVRGRAKEARGILNELETQSRQRRVSSVYLAKVYAGLGDKERALALLQHAYAERSDHVLRLGIDPIYDGLRSDPRFIEMLRGIGLAP
jgi:predicted Zn-dependent protease